jgi:hypothetical protein
MTAHSDWMKSLFKEVSDHDKSMWHKLTITEFTNAYESFLYARRCNNRWTIQSDLISRHELEETFPNTILEVETSWFFRNCEGVAGTIRDQRNFIKAEVIAWNGEFTWPSNVG